MILTNKEAGAIDGLSPSSRRRLVRAGAYPEPVRLTDRRIGFVRNEVEAWARERIAARDAGVKPEADPVVIATRPAA